MSIVFWIFFAILVVGLAANLALSWSRAWKDFKYLNSLTKEEFRDTVFEEHAGDFLRTQKRLIVLSLVLLIGTIGVLVGAEGNTARYESTSLEGKDETTPPAEVEAQQEALEGEREEKKAEQETQEREDKALEETQMQESMSDFRKRIENR